MTWFLFLFFSLWLEQNAQYCFKRLHNRNAKNKYCNWWQMVCVIIPSVPLCALYCLPFFARDFIWFLILCLCGCARLLFVLFIILHSKPAWYTWPKSSSIRSCCVYGSIVYQVWVSMISWPFHHFEEWMMPVPIEWEKYYIFIRSMIGKSIHRMKQQWKFVLIYFGSVQREKENEKIFQFRTVIKSAQTIESFNKYTIEQHFLSAWMQQR